MVLMPSHTSLSSGHIFQEVDPIAFAIFCGSVAENVHSAELVIFAAYPITKDIFNISFTYGATLLGFDPRSAPILERHNPSIYWWFFIHHYLSGKHFQWGGIVDNILFADVTKYMFSSDPFTLPRGDGTSKVFLLGNTPGVTLASKPQLLSLIETCFGTSMKAAAEAKSFSEADLVIGKGEYFRLLTKIVLTVILGKTDMGWNFPQCASSSHADRALLNIFVRLGVADGLVSIADPSLMPILDFSYQYLNKEEDVRSTIDGMGLAIVRDYSIVQSVHMSLAHQYASWLNFSAEVQYVEIIESICSEYHILPRLEILRGECDITYIQQDTSWQQCCAICDQLSGANTLRCTSFVFSGGYCYFKSCNMSHILGRIDSNNLLNNADVISAYRTF